VIQFSGRNYLKARKTNARRRIRQSLTRPAGRSIADLGWEGRHEDIRRHDIHQVPLPACSRHTTRRAPR
jgi:hypothetical protein